MGELKLYYTVGELARMAGVTYPTMRRILDDSGVEYLMAGSQRRVPLSEILEKVSGLGESIRLRAALQ